MPNSNPTVVVAFDAYGTLLSTESIAKKLASHFGDEKATTIATTWRKYQLEYTWRLNSMSQYEDFSKLTRRSLKNALSESKVSLEDRDLDDMMQAYNSLSAFPDVAQTMHKLKSTPDLKAVVFSNGTHSMVSSSINNSPDMSQYAEYFTDIVTIEEVKRYKPAPEAYHHLARKTGKDPKDAQQMGDLWLVSGNPFDVVGARAVGMCAVWVDRAGNGWQDTLVEGDKGRPNEIAKSLDEVIPTVLSARSDQLTSNWREMHGEREI